MLTPSYEHVNDYAPECSHALWEIDTPGKPARVKAYNDEVQIHDELNRCIVIPAALIAPLRDTLTATLEWQNNLKENRNDH